MEICFFLFSSRRVFVARKEGRRVCGRSARLECRRTTGKCYTLLSLSLSRNQNRAVEQVRRLEQPALHEESIGTKGYTGGCRRQESLSHPPEAVCPIHPRDTLSPLLTPVPLLSLRSATRVDCRSGHSLLTIQSNCQLKGRREKEEERVSFDDSCDLFQRKKCDVRCAKRARVEQPSSQEGGKRRVSGSS